jgi:hypothetical protein
VSSGIAQRRRRVEDALLGLPNVTGVGLGWKETRGRVTDVVAWRVYMRRKLPARSLRPEERVPAQVDGLPTDVIVAGTAVPTASYVASRVPLEPGATISNLRGVLDEPPAGRSGFGTLGFLALVNGSRERVTVLVSNRHVLLAHGAGRGDPVYRPVFSSRGVIRRDELEPVAAIEDEGEEGNVSYRYDGDEAPGEYFVDCTSARLLVESGVQQALRGVGRLHPLDSLGTRAPRVRKLGAFTGITEGRVVDVSAPVRSAEQPRRLNNVVLRGAPVDPGDSGALVVNERNEAVALVWGRDDGDPTIAYACHIHPVLDRLDVTVVTHAYA